MQGPLSWNSMKSGATIRAFEFMMNALRLTQGFATETFVERTGLPITSIQRQLDEAEQRVLIDARFSARRTHAPRQALPE